MRYAILILALLWAGPAWSVTLLCTGPGAPRPDCTEANALWVSFEIPLAVKNQLRRECRDLTREYRTRKYGDGTGGINRLRAHECVRMILEEWLAPREKRSARPAADQTRSQTLQAAEDTIRNNLDNAALKGSAVCGDGELDDHLNEECDDGDADSNDPCTTSCRDAVCGDGILCSHGSCTTGPASGPEECDEGANNDDAAPSGGCTTLCALVP